MSLGTAARGRCTQTRRCSSGCCRRAGCRAWSRRSSPRRTRRRAATSSARRSSSRRRRRWRARPSARSPASGRSSTRRRSCRCSTSSTSSESRRPTPTSTSTSPACSEARPPRPSPAALSILLAPPQKNARKRLPPLRPSFARTGIRSMFSGPQSAHLRPLAQDILDVAVRNPPRYARGKSPLVAAASSPRPLRPPARRRSASRAVRGRSRTSRGSPRPSCGSSRPSCPPQRSKKTPPVRACAMRHAPFAILFWMISPPSLPGRSKRTARADSRRRARR